MKKILFIFLALALAISSFAYATPAMASARTLSWTVSITYQNVGAEAATVLMNFYPEGESTPIEIDPLNGGTLAAGAGTSYFIGTVNNGIDSGFRGNAIISSDQPLVATVVQFHENVGSEVVKMRMLSNGFQSAESADTFLIATVFKNRFNRTHIFSIQNVTDADVTATIYFYDSLAVGDPLAATIQHVIPAYSSKYIEMDVDADTGLDGYTSFDGSAIVTVPTGSAVVAAASELYTNKDVGANFEGMPLSSAGNTIYMATGLCGNFGLDTFYAASNASLSDEAEISVEYRDANGVVFANDGPYTLLPGQKKAISTCTADRVGGGSMAGFTGSAVITSVGAPVAVLGKAQCTSTTTSGLACPNAQKDVFTIFMGQSSGSSTIALPFIRWANDADFLASTNLGGKQRTYLAIQNLEATSADVVVSYYDKAGNLCGSQTYTVAGGAKASSNPSTAGAVTLDGTGETGLCAFKTGSFGYYANGSFGGSVTIAADAANPDAKFVVIVRAQHPGAGEDYNGLFVP